MNWREFIFGTPMKKEIKSTIIGCLAQTILKDLELYVPGVWELNESGGVIDMMNRSTYHNFFNSKKNYTLTTQLSNYEDKTVNIGECHKNPLTKYEQSLIYHKLVQLSQRIRETRDIELKKVDDAFLQKTFPDCFKKQIPTRGMFGGKRQYYE